MSETGTIKFVAERSQPQLGSFKGLEELNLYRKKVRRLGLLGVDDAGIGFGNISVRDGASLHFYITGSNTGDKSELAAEDCAKVVQCHFSKNWLLFEGKAMPSSESLTHASIYQARRSVGAIIHGHHAQLWAFLLRNAPATRIEAEYGTPEMAKAVRDLLDTAFASDENGNAFAMSGHEGGIIIFGQNLKATFDALLAALKKSG